MIMMNVIVIKLYAMCVCAINKIRLGSRTCFPQIEIEFVDLSRFSSKCLRETVQYFGNLGWWYGKNEETNKRENKERGPFFCGDCAHQHLHQKMLKLPPEMAVIMV